VSGNTTMIDALARLVTQYYVCNSRFPDAIEVSAHVDKLLRQDLEEQTKPMSIDKESKLYILGVEIKVTDSEEIFMKTAQGEKF